MNRQSADRSARLWRPGACSTTKKSPADRRQGIFSIPFFRSHKGTDGGCLPAAEGIPETDPHPLPGNHPHRLLRRKPPHVGGLIPGGGVSADGSAKEDQADHTGSLRPDVFLNAEQPDHIHLNTALLFHFPAHLPLQAVIQFDPPAPGLPIPVVPPSNE